MEEEAESAESWLEQEAHKNSEAAEVLKKLKELYSSKLWHQLTELVEQHAMDGALAQGDLLLRLYRNALFPIEGSLSPLRVARIASAASVGCASTSDALCLIDGVHNRLSASTARTALHPLLYLRSSRALALLRGGDAPSAKETIDSCLSELDSTIEPDPSVPAAVHFAASQLHKARQEFADFYNHGLKYLAYTDTSQLPQSQRLELAVDLSLASLLGEAVYNFGELLAHPVMESLEGTQYEWLGEVMQAFNRGDLHEYDRLCNKYADQLNAQPALVQNERKLREKITVVTLMEIIFALPAENRIISLESVAEKTKLHTKGVELLLMKALSAHLIEGVIDQVKGTVRITWAKPRTLLNPQIQELRNKLDWWIGKVQSTIKMLENEQPELIGQV